MAKTILNSRSGSTVACLLVLGLSFTLVESNGFAQNMDNAGQNKIGDSTTLVLSPAAALNEKLTAIRAKLQTLDQAEAPEATVEASAAAAVAAPKPSAPVTSKIVSNVLLESLEATLNKMQDAASQDQSAVSAEQAIFYINEKLEALDRMIYLLEQKRAMQAVAGNYQQRLEAMQKKIEDRGSRALAGNLE